VARPRPTSLLIALFALLALTVATAPASALVAAPVPKLPNTSYLGTTKALRDCKPAPPAPPLIPKDYRAVSPSAPNPLLGETFLVSPVEPAWKQWRAYQRGGKNGSAALMWKVASQPRFGYFGRWTRPNLTKKIREYFECVHAIQPGAVPLMMVLRHQGKSCGNGYDGGGRKEDARTRSWYRRYANAVGNERVVIAFELDSLGTADCFKGGRYKDRMNLLRYGVDVLSKLPNATIYLEAGASDWEKASRTAKQLRYIGIKKVRGFMLNATHYDWTASNIKHGLKISRKTGGKHFIISTSLNGRGPVHFRKYYSKKSWRRITINCHPGHRGIGPNPTTKTAHPKVDAYVWIGRIGYSSGSCNGGPLPVGTWWPERALMLARNKTEWLRAPTGTKFGWSNRHFTLLQLGWCGDSVCR
jgi:endoglucanase